MEEKAKKKRCFFKRNSQPATVAVTNVKMSRLISSTANSSTNNMNALAVNGKTYSHLDLASMTIHQVNKSFFYFGLKTNLHFFNLKFSFELYLVFR